MAFFQDRLGHTAASSQKSSLNDLSLNSLMKMEFPPMYSNSMSKERDGYQNRMSGNRMNNYDFQNRPMRAEQNFEGSYSQQDNSRYQHHSGNLNSRFPRGPMELQQREGFRNSNSYDHRLDSDNHGRNMQNEQHKNPSSSSGFWRTDGFGLKDESFEFIKNFLQGSEREEPTSNTEAKKDLAGYVKNVYNRIEEDRLRVERHKRGQQQQKNGKKQTFASQNEGESNTGASQSLSQRISEPSTSWVLETNSYHLASKDDTYQSLSGPSSSAPPPFPNLFEKFSSRSDSHESPSWDRVSNRHNETETRDGGIMSLRHRSDTPLELLSKKRMNIERRKSSRRSRSRSPRRRARNVNRNRSRSRSPRRRDRFSPRRVRSPSPWRRRIPSPRGQRSPSPSRLRGTSPRGLRSPYARELRSSFSGRLRSPSPLGLGNLSPRRSRSPYRRDLSPPLFGLGNLSPRRSRSPYRRDLRSPSPLELGNLSPRRSKSPYPRDLRSPSPLGHGHWSPRRSRSPPLIRPGTLSPRRSGSPYPRELRCPSPLGLGRMSPRRSRSPYPMELRSPSPDISQLYSLQRGNGRSPSMSPPRYHNRSPQPYGSRSISPHQEDPSLFTPLPEALKLLISTVRKSLTYYSLKMNGKKFFGDILSMPPSKKRDLLLCDFELCFSYVPPDYESSNNAQRSLTDLLDTVLTFKCDHGVIVEVSANDDVIGINETKPYELAEYIREGDFTVHFTRQLDESKRKPAKTKTAPTGLPFTKTKSGVPGVFSRLGIKVDTSEQRSRPDNLQIHKKPVGSVFDRLGKKNDPDSS